MEISNKFFCLRQRAWDNKNGHVFDGLSGGGRQVLRYSFVTAFAASWICTG